MSKEELLEAIKNASSLEELKSLLCQKAYSEFDQGEIVVAFKKERDLVREEIDLAGGFYMLNDLADLVAAVNDKELNVLFKEKKERFLKSLIESAKNKEALIVLEQFVKDLKNQDVASLFDNKMNTFKND